MKQGKSVKVIVRLPEVLVNEVERLSAIKRSTVTATLSRFIERELFLNDEEAKGHKILLEDGRGKIRRVLQS